MNRRRLVVPRQEFVERLDVLLPVERPGDGSPSAADFVAVDLINIIEVLAEDFEGSTLPVPGDERARILITTGLLVPRRSVYAVAEADGVVDLYWLDIEAGA